MCTWLHQHGLYSSISLLPPFTTTKVRLPCIEHTFGGISYYIMGTPGGRGEGAESFTFLSVLLELKWHTHGGYCIATWVEGQASRLCAHGVHLLLSALFQRNPVWQAGPGEPRRRVLQRSHPVHHIIVMDKPTSNPSGL